MNDKNDVAALILLMTMTTTITMSMTMSQHHSSNMLPITVFRGCSASTINHQMLVIEMRYATIDY